MQTRPKKTDTLEWMSERLILATEAGKIGVWDWDIPKNELTWNSHMFNLYGMKSKKKPLTFEDWAKFVGPKQYEKTRKELDLALSGGPAFNTRFQIQLKNGHIRYIRAFAKVIFDKKKTPLRMIGVNYDVSQEEEIKLLKEELEAILNCIPIGVIVLDKSGALKVINHAAKKLSTYGNKLNVFLTRDGAAYPDQDNPISKAIQSGKPEKADDLYLKDRNDDFKVIKNIAVPMKDARNEISGTVALFEDITQEKNLEQRKVEFVSIASHQLRTPITSIKWLSEMLLAGDAGTLTEEQIYFIKQIQESNENMNQLVNDLLNVSRIELGTIHVHSERIDIQEVLKKVISTHKYSIHEKQLNLDFKADQQHSFFWGDPVLLEVITENLLSNAIKYTPEHGGIRISINREEKNYLIQIKDTGIGIPKSQESDIFKKMFRADNAKHLVADGNGIGLYMAKAFSKTMGGDLNFESKENKGTCFTLSLPYNNHRVT